MLSNNGLCPHAAAHTCTIFSNGSIIPPGFKFTESDTLTLAARSYALLLDVVSSFCVVCVCVDDGLLRVVVRTKASITAVYLPLPTHAGPPYTGCRRTVFRNIKVGSISFLEIKKEANIWSCDNHVILQ